MSDSTAAPATSTVVADKPRAVSNLKALAAAAKANLETRSTVEKDHELYLLNSLASYIAAQAEEMAVPAAERGLGWVKFYECHLPGVETITLDSGEQVTRPKNPPETTHWSGPGKDASAGGAPIVLLLQGPRGSDGKIRPWRLPGEKTAITLAQEILDKHEAEIKLECTFNPATKTVDVVAIWIEEDWNTYIVRRAAYRQSQRSARHGRAPPTEDVGDKRTRRDPRPTRRVEPAAPAKVEVEVEVEVASADGEAVSKE
jgi:hypothetical protein